MNALREGFEQWMEKERQRIDAKLLRAARTEGKAKGKAEGKLKGKAESLLKVLAARDISVSKKLREQILKCSDESKLDRWIERSVAARSAAELLEMH